MIKTQEYWNGYEIGYQAYIDGESQCNPFHFASDEYKGWNAGYTYAKRDNNNTR